MRIGGIFVPDRDKVIATAIEQLDWYFNEDDGGAAEKVTKIAYQNLKESILTLLKAQEPRVMDAEEVARLTEEIYQWLWIEEIQNITWNLYCLQAFVYSKHPDTGEFYIFANGYRDIVKLEGDEYGKTWRCWTSRPTDEQRKAVKWNV